MMTSTSRRIAWSCIALCAAIVLAALGWAAFTLEGQRRSAAQESAQQFALQRGLENGRQLLGQYQRRLVEKPWQAVRNEAAALAALQNLRFGPDQRGELLVLAPGRSDGLALLATFPGAQLTAYAPPDPKWHWALVARLPQASSLAVAPERWLPQTLMGLRHEPILSGAVLLTLLCACGAGLLLAAQARAVVAEASPVSAPASRAAPLGDLEAAVRENQQLRHELSQQAELLRLQADGVRARRIKQPVY